MHNYRLDSSENQSFGRWVVKERMKYKRCQNDNTSCCITKEQIEILNKIGFEWSILDALVSQQFSESHRMVAILTRKEETIERTPYGENSLSEIKVIEFSC
mmetsp:Transcript_1603/g.1692  ORF Transcript_1603/g.1692 Transcript_1603/m.1692 type:complete len:101 (+) Transcript_1603:62-364(+)